MSPILAAHDKSDQSLANAKLAAEGCLGDPAEGVSTANFMNLLLSEFGVGASFTLIQIAATIEVVEDTASANGTSASLRIHIGDVVGRCSQEQMLRVTAGPVIAMVTGKQSVGDWPIRQLPCHAVSKRHASIPTAEPNNPVPVVACSRPRPAAIRPARLIYLGPKAISQGDGDWSISDVAQSNAMAVDEPLRLGAHRKGQGRTAPTSTEEARLDMHRNYPFGAALPVVTSDAGAFGAWILPSSGVTE